MTHYADFPAFVAAATADENEPSGYIPYHYQCELAEKGFPDVLTVPTGSGKTMAAVLPHLWRRLYHPDPDVRSRTPRRLVIALPTRALIDQTGRVVDGLLSGLGLTDTVGVHVLMGGRSDRATQNAWRIDLHRPTIVICTLDMLVSRTLLRGYGSFRGSYPLDFALMCNGSHIVVDETQLVPQATATLRQISAFQKTCGTAEPSSLTIMSATIDERVLDTYDNPFDPATAKILGLPPEDAAGGLATRLNATRTVRRLAGADSPKALAQRIFDLHLPGTLTLAVLNTVESATDVYRQFGKLKTDEDVLLIHSRFRGVERKTQLERLDIIAASGGIVVATQAVEAGVDIDARTLITDAAPWPSIVQRAGRCNRAGRFPDGEATLWWRNPEKAAPYEPPQVEAAAAALDSAEGQALTSREIHSLGSNIEPGDLALRILRRRDFNQLFDTAPDLGGSDIDISVYIRPDQDLDVHLAWVPDDAMRPGLEVSAPPRELNINIPPENLRCGVSLTKARAFFKDEKVKAWVFRPQEDRWVAARHATLRPQDIVLVEASSGGYQEELGFDPKSRAAVDPKLGPDKLMTASVPEAPAASQDPGAGGDGWLSLEQHLMDARDQAASLVKALSPGGLPEDVLHAAVVASLLHDLGKAHPDWNRALREANPEHPPPDSETLYAKSPGHKALRVMRRIPISTTTDVSENDQIRTEPRTGFRHELVSVFMLSSPDGARLLTGLGVRPELHGLVRYLVGAHHGHLRLSVRDPRYDGRDGRTLLGCDHDEPTPAIRLGFGELPASVIDLGIFHAGRPDSWTPQVLALRDAFGPFRLAYLETLVRMADWRASANLPLAGESS